MWIYTCIVHRFFDERRKDYFILYVHHIVTIMLVAGSFSGGYLRVGLLVLWVHDVSDVLVDLLKMVNYLKLESFKGFFASEITYVSCVVGWVYWRLYQFPFRVIRGALVDPFYLLAPQPRVDDGLAGFLQVDLPGYNEMNVLLFILLALHIYWFHLFLMIGYRILKESAREASRQEYEGDSDDETEFDARDSNGGNGKRNGRHASSGNGKQQRAIASPPLATLSSGSNTNSATNSSTTATATAASTSTATGSSTSAKGEGKGGKGSQTLPSPTGAARQ